MHNKLNIVIRTPIKEDIPTLLQWGRLAPEAQAINEATWQSKDPQKI